MFHGKQKNYENKSTSSGRSLIKTPNLDKEVLENYWLVYNLPFLSKMLEKVVATRSESHLSTQKLHNDVQTTKIAPQRPQFCRTVMP